MTEALQTRLEGFRRSIQEFNAALNHHLVSRSSLNVLQETLAVEMGKLGFDSVDEDSLGTIYGIIKGIEPGEDLLLVTHLDDETPLHPGQSRENRWRPSPFKAGICSAFYAAGALKSSLLPLRGDLIVCCVPRVLFGSYAIEHFYQEIIKPRPSKLKGVILCEPTNANLHLGHKGRIEYEILIQGHVGGNTLRAGGLNMLGGIFPLVNELEKVSTSLPEDRILGRSSLRIKDIQYNNPGSPDVPQEFRLSVDRVFVPEESPEAILAKAKNIASSVYRTCDDLQVSTTLVSTKYKGATVEEEATNELKPWVMPGHNPFVFGCLQALQEEGFHTDYGFWKSTFTEGSYLCGTLGIPTLGFGPGSEDTATTPPKLREIERIALGQAIMIHRAIGIPSFGWCADEI